MELSVYKSRSFNVCLCALVATVMLKVGFVGREMSLEFRHHQSIADGRQYHGVRTGNSGLAGKRGRLRVGLASGSGMDDPGGRGSARHARD